MLQGKSTYLYHPLPTFAEQIYMVNEFQSHSTHLKKNHDFMTSKDFFGSEKNFTSAFLSYILENERLEHNKIQVGKMIVPFQIGWFLGSIP